MIQINIDGDSLKDAADNFLKDEQAVRELSIMAGVPYEYFTTQEGFQWMILAMIITGLGGGM